MEERKMNRLFTTLILTLFTLTTLFHGTHIQYDRESDFPANQGFLTQYPKIPDMVVYPMANIPF